MACISTSENYYHEFGCQIDECERHYCARHRTLWRNCDTASFDREGSGRGVYVMGDCPKCEQDSRRQTYARAMEAA